jgi:hypothetical protein
MTFPDTLPLNVPSITPASKGHKEMLSEHKEQELVLLSLSILRLAFLATPTGVRSRAFLYAVM